MSLQLPAMESNQSTATSEATSASDLTDSLMGDMDTTFITQDQTVIDLSQNLDATRIHSDTNTNKKRIADTSVYELQLSSQAAELRHISGTCKAKTSIGLQTTSSLNQLSGDNFELFKNVWKLTHQGLKIQAQIELLEGFQVHGLIPTGFQTGIRPAAMIDTEAYHTTFEGLQRACSNQFISLTRDHLTLKLRQTEADLTLINTRLNDTVQNWGDKAAIEIRIDELTNKEKARLDTANQTKIQSAKDSTKTTAR